MILFLAGGYQETSNRHGEPAGEPHSMILWRDYIVQIFGRGGA